MDPEIVEFVVQYENDVFIHLNLVMSNSVSSKFRLSRISFKLSVYVEN